MAELPVRRLAGFYFCYFAYLGAFAPFFGLYLDAAGLSAFAIGAVMALPGAARLLAPYLWAWLADVAGAPMRIVRATTAAAAACWLGIFAAGGPLAIGAVVLAVSVLLSAALPLVEARTLERLGEAAGRYGRIRLWGSLGYIGAVLALGYALDRAPIAVLLWAVLAALAATAAFGGVLPDSGSHAARAQAGSVASVLARREVASFIAACALLAAAHGPYYAFYSLHLAAHGYSRAATGWLWAIGVGCEIAIFFWLPRLFAAWTLAQILGASLLLAALRFALIGWAAQHLALLVVAQALHAASFGSAHAAAVNLAYRLFPEGLRARGQALYGSLTYGVGGTFGSLAGGSLWTAGGPELAFGAAAAAALAAWLLLRWGFAPGRAR